MQTFGEVLRRERKRRPKLSQGALGEALGVKQQTVSNWETDDEVPEPENLLKLRQYFGAGSPLWHLDPTGRAHTRTHAVAEPTVRYSVRHVETAPRAGVSSMAPISRMAQIEARVTEQLPQHLMANVDQRVPMGSRQVRFFYLSDRVAAGLCELRSDLGVSSLAPRQLLNFLLLQKLSPSPNRTYALILVGPLDGGDSRRAHLGTSAVTFEAELLGLGVYQARTADDVTNLLIDLESNDYEELAFNHE